MSPACPCPELGLHLERPKTPARQFPADSDPAGVIIPGHASVDLTFERSRLLSGSFAGQPVELHATFHLQPGYFFDRGTITGHIGAEDLHATVERASGGLGGTRTVAVDGTLGSTEFTIYATIDGPLTFGQIRGTVAGTPIRIDAARTRQPDAEKTRLTGSYQGPPALLALAAGALLHFI